MGEFMSGSSPAAAGAAAAAAGAAAYGFHVVPSEQEATTRFYSDNKEESKTEAYWEPELKDAFQEKEPWEVPSLWKEVNSFSQDYHAHIHGHSGHHHHSSPSSSSDGGFCQKAEGHATPVAHMPGLRWTVFAGAGHRECINVLFPRWTPQSWGQWILALVLVVLVGVVTEWVSKWRIRTERTIRRRQARAAAAAATATAAASEMTRITNGTLSGSSGNGSQPPPSTPNGNPSSPPQPSARTFSWQGPQRWRQLRRQGQQQQQQQSGRSRDELFRRLALGAVHAVQAIAGYLLMVLTMSYSWDIIAAVVMGLIVGYAIFFGHEENDPNHRHLHREGQDARRRQQQRQGGMAVEETDNSNSLLRVGRSFWGSMLLNRRTGANRQSYNATDSLLTAASSRSGLQEEEVQPLQNELPPCCRGGSQIEQT